jgi:hypothetical protein
LRGWGILERSERAAQADALRKRLEAAEEADREYYGDGEVGGSLVATREWLERIDALVADEERE